MQDSAMRVGLGIYPIWVDIIANIINYHNQLQSKEEGSLMKKKQAFKQKTGGPRTLALCLTHVTAAVGMTLAIFCRLVSKTHCCKLNQLKSGLTLTQYLTMDVSI